MVAPRRSAAATGALLIAAALSGCGDHASPPAPHPTGSDARACASFMNALPDSLADQPRESGGTDYQASYGSPAIVVSCGVGVPPGFEVGVECQVANGVGWYLSPDKAYDDQSLDVTVTAAGYRPRVGVFIPAKYRPSAIQGVIGQLALRVQKNFRKATGCV